MTRQVSAIPLALAWLAGGTMGCTTLGPMPATTGISAIPAGRPSGEMTFGGVPGYYLSSGVQPSSNGAVLTQGSLLIEPDRLIRLPGVVVGARHIGDSNDPGYFEPLVGYRCHLDRDERISSAAIGYFTKAKGSRDGASYSATRGGVEMAFDARITPRSKWFEVHGGISAALTGLSVSGHYCLDEAKLYGADCGGPQPPPGALTAVNAAGLYPSASAEISLAFAHHLETFFHGGRLGLSVATGTMPTAIGGQQKDARWYGSAGATLTLGFGSPR